MSDGKKAFVTRLANGQILGVYVSRAGADEAAVREMGRGSGLIRVTEEEQGSALDEWLEAADEAEERR